MKIIKGIYSNRNDYVAEFECEHCSYKMKAWGYSDDNFDNNVIPNVSCLNCGLDSLGNPKSDKSKRLREGRYYEDNTLNLTNNVSFYYVIQVFNHMGKYYLTNNNKLWRDKHDDNIKRYKYEKTAENFLKKYEAQNPSNSAYVEKIGIRDKELLK